MLGFASLQLCCFPLPGLEDLAAIFLAFVAVLATRKGAGWFGNGILPSSSKDPETPWTLRVRQDPVFQNTTCATTCDGVSRSSYTPSFGSCPLRWMLASLLMSVTHKEVNCNVRLAQRKRYSQNYGSVGKMPRSKLPCHRL